jgi:phosphopentomutase
LAAHKEVIPLQELYAICGIARELLAGEHNVCRVIARPFIGSPGKFKRVNEERRDFSLLPPRETVLDCVLRSRKLVLGAGKVADLFGGRGFSSCPHTANNSEALHELIRMIGEDSEGVIMVNLVDFDMVYGHRNDCEGFANALAEFDAFLPEVERALHSDDVCFITSDHGCDPTYPGTDHTREYGLFLAFGPQIKGDTDIGVRQSFADCGKTVSELLGLNCRLDGFSFAELIT